MAKKRITSKPGLFGMVYHYDENGKYVGKSRPGLLKGTKVHFDEKGKQVGSSRPGIFWEEVHHDAKNNRDIVSFPSVINTIHRSDGRTVGTTRPGLFDRSYTTFENDEGEYIEDCESQEYSEDNGLFSEMEDLECDVAFSEVEDIEYDEEEVSAECEEEPLQVDRHPKQGKEFSDPVRSSTLEIIVIGLFIFGFIGCFFVAIKNILSGNNAIISVIAFALCCLIFKILMRFDRR